MGSKTGVTSGFQHQMHQPVGFLRGQEYANAHGQPFSLDPPGPSLLTGGWQSNASYRANTGSKG